MRAGPRPARARSAAQAKVAAIGVRIRAVDRDARDAVARGLVGEHPDRRLLPHRRRQRRLVVLDAEHRGQPPRGAQVDRLVPFAERRPALADERERHAAEPFAPERHRHPGNRQRADRERRGRGQDPQYEDRRRAGPCRPSAAPPCAICAESTIRTASGAGRMASATPRSRMTGAMTSPCHTPRRSVRLTPAQPDSGGVDRFLAERSETLCPGTARRRTAPRRR